MSETDGKTKSVSELSRAIESYSPSQFMRARRPELFSDSKVLSGSLLARDVLDYRLAILTSKKQETDFEHFCRRICEQEICPNLAPQTGPTGGGDSKVDSENHPVSELISMRWYQGLPQDSEDVRWAFAFSAKREWRSKVRADVDSIISTKRGYKLIYFITNQYVKDSTRAKIEDQLAEKHGVRVRILDRTWLLKCVFEHGRQLVAIETLHLDLSSSSSVQVGPKDLVRAEQLDETEARISDTLRYQGVEYQLVEDCLSAALLSRNLERPRTETEGRFSRAARLADKIGIAQQRLRVTYNRAWTAYWWYEDFDEFLSHYDIVEPFALESTLADDVELAVNLWQLLYAACAAGRMDKIRSGLEDRKHRLNTALKKLSDDLERPNNALSARTHIAFLEILTSPRDKASLVPAISGLSKIVSESEGLVDYPVEPFAKIVDELGVLFADIPQYDELVESVVKLTQQRAGKQQAGRVLLSRGFQKLRALRAYDAIRFFGRAQQMLALREARDELTSALFAGGVAYEAAGLLWAARANTLSSANCVFAELREGGRIPDNALLCARKLIWLELQLGRVAHVLEWIEVAGGLAGNQGLDPEQKEEFLHEREAQDVALGLLFLKADLPELMEMRFLPDVLEHLDLHLSRVALLYALGYEDLLHQEGSIPENESSDVLLSTFKNLMEESAVSDLPPGPTALGGGNVAFVSPVLGCRVTAIPEPDYESQRLAERILAGVEALLATSLAEQVFPYREELAIEIRRDSEHKGVPQIEKKLPSVTNISVIHGGSISDTGQNWFLDILLSIFTKLVMVPELKGYAGRIFGDESALARSVNFSESAITISNLLGRNPKLRIPDWNIYKHPRAYVPIRMAVWHGGIFDRKRDTVNAEFKLGEGNPPDDLLERDKTKHTERRVFALIDIPIWDEAKWKGVLYIWPANIQFEPWLALGFENGEAAKTIFSQWLEKLGNIDKEDRIRISVLTGIDRTNPQHYSVVVGSNLVKSEELPRVKEFVSISRINRMTPPTSRNLEEFRRRFERVGTYRLMPASLDVKTGKFKPYSELAIQKRQLRITPAWQVQENDPDGVGIFPDDEPEIPAGIENPPVLKLLERKRKSSKKP